MEAAWSLAAAAGLGPGGTARIAGCEVVAVAAICAVLMIYLVTLKRKRTYDLDRIPGPWKHAWPIVGNVLECLRPDFHRVMLGWADQYGGIIRGQFFHQSGLIVTDPAALAAIMGRGEGAMDKAAVAYAPINRMCTPHGAANLLTSSADDSWKAVRKAVAVSFSIQNIKKKFPLVLGRINQLCEQLAAAGPGTAVDVDQAALRVTLDVIGLAGFGHDYASVSQHAPAYDHLLRVLPRCFTEVMMRIANPLRPLLPGLFKNGHKGSAAFAAFQSEMNSLLKQLEAKGTPADDDTDIGSQLLRAMQQSGGAISRERVLSEIGMLFVEGFETTGHTTSWTLFNIASMPGVQEQIAAELDGLGLLAKPGCPPQRELEWEDLKRMPYLTACAKEAMRMLPVVSIMARVAGTDGMKVGPYRVPRGTLVATPLFAIHNTHHNWDEPEQYKPERWLGLPTETYVYNSRAGAAAGAAEGAAAAGGKGGITFMPFSEGPRNCVGQSLAKMEVLSLLAKLCANFTISLAPEMGGRDGVRSRESTHLTLQTAGTKGIRCLLQPRVAGV